MRFIFWCTWIICIVSPFASTASTFDEGINAVHMATLVVHSDDTDDRFLGSAFVFQKGMTVVTNAHVIGASQTVMLKDIHGDQKRARVVFNDTLRDIAILKVDTPYITWLMPFTGNVSVAQPVLAIGAPLQEAYTVTKGIVSGLQRQKEPTAPIHFLQHDAAINPGSSGGPLINTDGLLVGMNTQIADGSRYFAGLAYAIPVDEILNRITAHHLGTDKPTLELGLRVRNISEKIRQALLINTTNGVLVDYVDTHKVAALSGVLAGDILVKIGPYDIKKTGDIAFAIADLNMNNRDNLITVIRVGTSLKLPIILPKPKGTKLGLMGATPHKKTSYSLKELGIEVLFDGEIKNIEPSGIGHTVGLRAGDKIIAINGRGTADQTAGWGRTMRFSRPVLVLLKLSDGSTRHFILDPWTKYHRLVPMGNANILDQDIVVF